jgi:hypothetical protein
VTAAQFLAELMCERQARQQKIWLPQEFWKSKQWGPIFKHQLGAITRHLTRLDPKVEGKRRGTAERALSRFLRSEAGKKVYSLAALWIVPFIEQAHREVLAGEDGQAPADIEVVAPNPSLLEAPRSRPTSGQSIFAKLKEMET